MTEEMRHVLSHTLSDLWKNFVKLTLPTMMKSQCKECSFGLNLTNIRLSQIPSMHSTFPIMLCTVEYSCCACFGFTLLASNVKPNCNVKSNVSNVKPNS